MTLGADPIPWLAVSDTLCRARGRGDGVVVDSTILLTYLAWGQFMTMNLSTTSGCLWTTLLWDRERERELFFMLLLSHTCMQAHTHTPADNTTPVMGNQSTGLVTKSTNLESKVNNMTVTKSLIKTNNSPALQCPVWGYQRCSPTCLVGALSPHIPWGNQRKSGQ